MSHILEQGRAGFAYERALKAKNSNNIKEYSSYVKKMPMMIKTNGLAQALAFAYSKGKEWYDLYTDIQDWLKKDNKKLLTTSKIYNGKDNQKMIELIINMDSKNYRRTTVEVLSFLEWLKRFADGLEKEDKKK